MNARDVLTRTDLAALLTELTGEPVGSGPRARWHCCDRDHPDEHPSVTMFIDRDGIGRWRCWSGGHAGTAIDALIAAQPFTVAAAISVLAERLHGPAPQRSTTRTADRTSARAFSDAARHYAMACAELLNTPAAGDAVRWLRARGLSAQVLAVNQVGYDPGPRRLPREHGLPTAGGVTFPSYDAAGQMIYVQTRHLHPDSPRKYSNPTVAHGDVPAVTFPHLGPDVNRDRPVVVTEGVPDGLIAVDAGFRAATVISASLANRRSADEIVRYTGPTAPVYLALDNDPAGRVALETLHRHLNGRVAVRVLQLPDGHDLTDTYLNPTGKRPRCQPTPNNSPTASVV